MRCFPCGTEIFVPCRARSASVCVPCERRYRSQVRTVARTPLLKAPPGSVVLLTLTAPGSQRHCWKHVYVQGGKQRPSVRCGIDEADGSADESAHVECPCSRVRLIDDEAIGAWNATLGTRWNHFITDLRRSVPGFRDVQYFRALETQRRGALHVHALLRVTRQVVLTPERMQEVRRIAMRHGFGHEVDAQAVGAGALDQVTAARYVAKYVSKSSASQPLMPKADTAPTTASCRVLHARSPRSGGHPAGACRHDRTRTERKPFLMRLWATSRRWGSQLSVVRAAQRLFASGDLAGSEAVTEEALKVVGTAPSREQGPGS